MPWSGGRSGRALVIFEILPYRCGVIDVCRGRVVVLVDHASGIFACRAYGLPPLEADSVIFGFALLIEMCFFDCCRGRVVVLLILGFALLIEVE